MEHETFWSLLRDPAHWLFELFLMALFDGLIGLLIWPTIRQKLLHHQSDDQKIEELERQMQEVRAKLEMKNGNE
jgi:hypothetical protein